MMLQLDHSSCCYSHLENTKNPSCVTLPFNVPVQQEEARTVFAPPPCSKGFPGFHKLIFPKSATSD